MDKFGVTLSFPSPGAQDVAKRVLVVTPENGEEKSVELPATAMLHEIVVEQGVKNTIELFDTDESGNRDSTPLRLELTQTDTIAPDTQGDLTVSRVREVFGDEPVGPVQGGIAPVGIGPGHSPTADQQTLTGSGPSATLSGENVESQTGGTPRDAVAPGSPASDPASRASDEAQKSQAAGQQESSAAKPAEGDASKESGQTEQLRSKEKK